MKFGTLPRAGGLHDQPKLLMHRMKIALNTYDNVKAFRQAQDLPAEALGKWSNANPRIVEFMNWLWKLQGIFDG